MGLNVATVTIRYLQIEIEAVIFRNFCVTLTEVPHQSTPRTKARFSDILIFKQLRNY
jgi:hypothetical protein